MPLSEATALFLSAIYGELAASTCQQYAYALTRLEPLSQCPLDSITGNMLRVVRTELAIRYAPASVNMFFRTWKVFFMFCVAESLLPVSPAVRMRPLKEPPKIKAANVSDVRRMIAEAHQRGRLRDYAIMMLFLSTGCRVGALCRLRLDQIDHATQTARLLEKGGRWHTVNLIATTYLGITDYVDNERPNKSVSPLVFLSYNNGSRGLNRVAVMLMLRRYAVRLNITSPVNPHAFRHCFTVEMLRNGAPLDVVSKLLGHSSVAITERYYAKWDTGTLRDIHARLNPALIS